MKAILHADREWGIGRNNGLMFSIPADMKFFRETTTGNVVVMGSNTLDRKSTRLNSSHIH